MANKPGQATRSQRYMAEDNEYIVGIVSTSGGDCATVAADGSYIEGVATAEFGWKTLTVTFKYMELSQ